MGGVLWSSNWPTYPTIWVRILLKATVFFWKMLLEKNENKNGEKPKVSPYFNDVEIMKLNWKIYFWLL